MKKAKFILLTIASAFSLLCACSKEQSFPEDNQANHGALAIMETENGYYYNWGNAVYFEEENASGASREYKHLLRYSDKETGETILVCNKPECEHNGNDSCTATYKDISVINSILYNDAIYVYGIEEDGIFIRFNLYRIAPDGSAIDKVGTVFECENTLGEGYSIVIPEISRIPEPFIIHKGYAYLPYFVRIGKASRGFMGGGLMQMDITTGETKSIYEMEYMTSEFPYNLRACGDYVYIFMRHARAMGGDMRYVISEDRLEQPNPEWKMTFGVITSNRLYNVGNSYNPETQTTGVISVTSYDSVTGAWIDAEYFETDILGDPNRSPVTLPYKDMLVICTNDRVTLYGIGEENYGDKLGEIFFEAGERVSGFNREPVLEFKITNDTLYRVCTPIETEDNELLPWIPVYYMPYEVYSCPIEDVLNGTGQWEKVFSYEEVQ